MITFKDYLKKLKKKKKQNKLPQALTSFKPDGPNVPKITTSLPAATSGSQPRLS